MYEENGEVVLSPIQEPLADAKTAEQQSLWEETKGFTALSASI
jgi:hypothetical protein